MTTPHLSIVIPAFNEEKRIVGTLGQILAFLDTQDYTFEVIVANDGSTDSTASLTREIARTNPRLVLLDIEHRGKGHAVRTGMLAAQGSYHFFVDADLSMPVNEIPKFLPPSNPGAQVTIGSREKSGAHRYNEPSYRHFMGRVFNKLVNAMAVRGIRDTQCGFKCFTAAASKKLFSQQRINGFGFDVEILLLAKKANLDIIEIPIDWYYQPESKVRPVRDTLRMLLDIARIHWNFLRQRYTLN